MYNIEAPGPSLTSFCEHRLNPLIVNEIVKKGKSTGLSNHESLERALGRGEYIPVLEAVWSERNRDHRLQWLRSHELELHAPLMYEQAIAEFVANPIYETLEISIPLIKAATFRMRQDEQCCSDPSVSNGDATVRIEQVYRVTLNQQVEKYLHSSFVDYIVNHRSELNSSSVRKVQDVARTTIDAKLPPPNYTRYHGIDHCFFGRVSMHPAQDHRAIRNRFATEESPMNYQVQREEVLVGPRPV